MVQNSRVVAVIGQGYVGLPLALCLAKNYAGKVLSISNDLEVNKLAS